MKKIYLLLSIVVVSIITINLLYYSDIYKQQLHFQKNLLFQQAEICGSSIEKFGYTFESDINFILFSDDISKLFNDDDIRERGLVKLQLFYLKYEDIVDNIKIFDREHNVYSLFRDTKGKFINDYYVSQRQRSLVEREQLLFDEGEYFYCMPVFSENEVLANIVVKINFLEYFNEEFNRYHLGNTLWQWLIDQKGNVISQNLTNDTIQITNLDKVLSNIEDENEGFIKHQVTSKDKKEEIVSAFYPVRILSQNFGIVFSLKTDVILKIIIRKTVIVSAFSFTLLIITILYFVKLIKRRNDDQHDIEKEKNILIKIIENLPIGIIILNKDKVIKNINKTAEDLLFLKSDETLIGKNISERFLIPTSYLRDEENPDLVFDSSQFIYYEKEENEIVLYKKEIPISIDKDELSLEAFIDVTPLEKSRKMEATANNAKSDFLAKMSHEIRTPMNGIIGMTDALLNQALSDEQKDFVKIIKKSADLLLTIINDILDFSKIEAGKMKLEEVPFKLSDELHLSIELFKPIASEKKITIESKIAENVHDNIIGDPFRLRQVLSNLIGNAVKFTHEGKILISVSQIEEYSGNITLLFTIEDTGIGIPKDRINTIFSSFTQAEGSTSRKYGGSGLGTTICKQLVDLMNGEIWAESPGSISNNPKYPGTKFCFTIEVFSNERLQKNCNYSYICDFSQVNVLYIDSNGSYDEKILDTYKNLKINITCKPKEEALQILNDSESTEVYHLIIIKNNITFDGFDVAKSMYKDGVYNDYIISIFSSHDVSGNYVRSKRMGIDYYLMKPYNNSEIFNIIKENFVNIDFKNVEKVKHLKKDINILVAEDNIINQKVAQTIFNNLGYKIEIARDGDEALEKISHQKFDIVFMDLQMPIKDGMETTTELRANGHLFPIVAMTASAGKQIEKKALSVGMNDFLVKPVKVETVKNLLTKWFSEE